MVYYKFQHTFENQELVTSKSDLSEEEMKKFQLAFRLEEAKLPKSHRKYYLVKADDINQQKNKTISLSCEFIGGLENDTLLIEQKTKIKQMIPRNELVLEILYNRELID
jgi:hypothetical protein